MEKRKLVVMVFSLWIVIVAGAVYGLALHKNLAVENYAVYSYRRGMKLVDLDIAPAHGITFYPDPISLPELEEFMVQDAIDSFSGQLLVLSDISSINSEKVCRFDVERGKIVAVVIDPTATLEQKSVVRSFQSRVLSSLSIPSASLRVKWVKGSPAEISPQAFYTNPGAQRHYDGSIGFDTNARIQGVRIFLDIENGIVVAVRTPRLTVRSSLSGRAARGMSMEQIRSDPQPQSTTLRAASPISFLAFCVGDISRWFYVYS